MLVPLADRYMKDISKNLNGWHVRRPNDGTTEVEQMKESIQLQEMAAHRTAMYTWCRGHLDYEVRLDQIFK